jgi:hypothetical protein
MFGVVDLEPFEAVEADPGEQVEGVGSRDGEVDHVIGQVEEHAGVLPCPLLITPVGELRGHTRV